MCNSTLEFSQMTSSQILDVIVLGVIVICAIRGASRGLISQSAMVIALVLCFKFADVLTPAVEPLIHVAPPLNKWISMLIVYMGLCLASFIGTNMLRSWVTKMKLQDFDRHLGALLGGLTGVIICMVGIFFGLVFSESFIGVVSQSYAGSAAATIVHHADPVLPLFPEQAGDLVRKVRDTLHDKLHPDEQLGGATDSQAETFGGDVQTGQPSSQGQGSWLDVLTSPGSTANPNDSAGSSDSLVQQIVNQLGPKVRDELTSSVVNSIRRSTPEQQRDLLKRISTAVDENQGSILDAFVRGSSGQGTAVTLPSDQLSARNRAILQEIASMYRDPRAVFTESQQSLAGVPEEVQWRVLEDWNADVMLLQQDPDQATNLQTAIDVRIVRQMAGAGISLDRLGGSLRLRLSQVRP